MNTTFWEGGKGNKYIDISGKSFFVESSVKLLSHRSVLNQFALTVNDLYPEARNAFNQLCQDITINSTFRKTNYAIQQLKGL